MKTTVSLEIHDGYLKVFLSGPTPDSEAQTLLLQVKELCLKHSKSRIAVDAFGLSELTILERYHLGELIAGIFGPDFKIAVFCKREHINKVMENVAVNRGAIVNVFSQETEATEWLMA